MQLATWTRPDISHSVSILSQFLFKSSSRTLDIGSKSSELPQTIQDFVLFLSSEQRRPVTNSPMLKAAGNSELLTFTDSDFASCEETRKIRSGSCIFFCNSLMRWKSGKQNHVSRSTHRSWVLCSAWRNHRCRILARYHPLCLQSWQKNLKLQ